MFKAIANWFKGLTGKAEQEVAKDKEIVDSFEKWKNVVNEIPTAKAEEVAKPYPVVAEETVAPAKVKKTYPKKASTKPAKETAKKADKPAKTSTKPAQKPAKSSTAKAKATTPKSKTTKTTK